MREGWGCAISPRTRAADYDRGWMQEGGIGLGGKSINIPTTTIFKLYRLELIEKEGDFNNKYFLTPLGKTIEL